MNPEAMAKAADAIDPEPALEATVIANPYPVGSGFRKGDPQRSSQKFDNGIDGAVLRRSKLLNDL